MSLRRNMRRRQVFAAAIVCVALSTISVRADDIHVMTSGAFTAAYLDLLEDFQRASGHRLVTEATSTGVGATSIPARLAAGEAIDVVIVDDHALNQLIADGRVAPDRRVELARSAIGMAVRAGAPKPDIRTTEALVRTLLAAKSIAYSASVSGTYLTTELFPRLGIAEQVLPKSTRIDTERVAAVVARGDAEIGFQQISELLAVPGVDLVGALPDDVQRVTIFSAGIAASSRHPEAARQLIEFLASAESVAAIRKSGMEPVRAVTAAGRQP